MRFDAVQDDIDDGIGYLLMRIRERRWVTQELPPQDEAHHAADHRLHDHRNIHWLQYTCLHLGLEVAVQKPQHAFKR